MSLDDQRNKNGLSLDSYVDLYHTSVGWEPVASSVVVKGEVMEDPVVAFYDCCSDGERLAYTTLDDAVLYHLDGLDKPLPKTVEVYRFARVAPSDAEKTGWARLALDQLIDAIDEEHGDPDDSTHQDESMLAAAHRFVDEVLATYTQYGCSMLPGSEQVDVVAWVEKHQPQWLRLDANPFGGAE